MWVQLLVPLMALMCFAVPFIDGADEGEASDPEEPSEEPTIRELLDPGSESEPGSEVDPATEEGDSFEVADGESATGTAGDDLFSLTPDPASFFDVTIYAGEGDDTLTLNTSAGFDLNVDPALSNAEIDAEAGADVIDFTSDSSTFRGGAGDDTITGLGVGNAVFGGEGNDQIAYLGGAGPGDTIDGGAGDDIVDTRGSQNISVFGGEGNDLLLMSGLADSTTGYVTLADGGDGDDTIRHFLDQGNLPETATGGNPNAAAVLTGGAGADVFELILGTGFAAGFTESDAQDASESGPIAVSDFATGEDQLVIDVTSALDNATPTEARLEEDTAAGITTMTLAFETPDAVPVELSVQLTGTGITWDDIAFVGGTPTLAPLQGP